MFLTSFVGAILKNMEWPVVGESTSPTKLLNVEYVSDPVQYLKFIYVIFSNNG